MTPSRDTLPLAAASQAQLLREPVFRAFFIVQFTGAFNDNFYKSALLMLFTYGGLELWGLGVDVVNNLVAAVLVLPFLLVAPLVSQCADRFEHSRLMRGLKVAEVLIMVAGLLALVLGASAALLLVLLAAGIQSACFSPLKQAFIPQLVKPSMLVGANGLMHACTSMAIFLGLIAGSICIQLPAGRWWVGLGALLLALWGWQCSRRLPRVPVADARLPLHWHPGRQLARSWRHARSEPQLLWLIVAISWYWLLGSVYLTQLPNLARAVLQAEPALVPVLLLVFLLGVSGGGLCSERFNRGHTPATSLRLVLLAAALIAAGGVGLWLATAGIPGAPALRSLPALAQLPGSGWLLLWVLLLGFGGGLFVVPLQALLQVRSPGPHRAQIMGVNNMINALFMLLAALLAALGLGALGLSIPQLFVLISALHLLFCMVLCWRVPLFRAALRSWLPG